MGKTAESLKESHTSFLHYPAVSRLQKLAKHPVDLTRPGVLSPERITKYVAEACGYRFMYGTERVTEEVLDAFKELIQEAQLIEKIKAMQAGEVINKINGFSSENRPVLHTATRDFFDHRAKAAPAVEAAQKSLKEVEKLRRFLEKNEKTHQFKNMVCIGIGGSDLGPRAHYIALSHLLLKGKEVRFISNVDPDDAAMAIKGLDLSETLVLVVSKTGTTLETLSNAAFVRARFEQQGLDSKHHFIAVSSKGSPLDDKDTYLECFYIWDWIGGRFSTTSMVGGVMLALAFGFDVYWEFLRGVSAMDKSATIDNIDENLPLLGALLSIWNRNFLGYPTLALIPYSQALSRYSAHVQQVEMESNGKHIDKQGKKVDFQTGAIIWGEPGTNAQHSFYQLIHQGTAIIPLEFIGFKHSQCGQDCEYQGTTLQQKLLANLFAQMIALAAGQKNDNPNKDFQGNRPSHLLLADQLTPFSLGSLLGYMEHKVAFEGFIWDINSFDQEGVQLGKVLAQKIIDLLADKNKESSYPLGEAFLDQLKLLKSQQG